MIRDQRNYGPAISSVLSATVKALVESVVPLKVNVTSLGNIADQLENVLSTYSIPANTMGSGGVHGFEIEAWGTFAANGDNKQVKLYFGAAVIATGVVTTNAKNWWLRLKVFRTSSNNQIVVGDGQIDTTNITPTVTTATETETAAIVAKCTGQGTTGNTANEVVHKLTVVRAIEQKNVT